VGLWRFAVGKLIGDMFMTNSSPDSQPPTSASEPKKRACVLCSVMLAVAATLVAIVMVVLVGVASWGAVVGTRGSWIGALIGAVLGLALRRYGHWLPRLIGGFLGGMIGGYFAVAAAEQAVPGSSEWAIRGGLLGAAFGVPVAMLFAAIVGALVRLVPPCR
jgi:hypothetical protein